MEEIITLKSAEFKKLVAEIDSATDVAESQLNGRGARLCLERNLSGDELRLRLHISRRTLQEYRDNWTIPYTSIGGKILYPESGIERLLKENYQPARKWLENPLESNPLIKFRPMNPHRR